MHCPKLSYALLWNASLSNPSSAQQEPAITSSVTTVHTRVYCWDDDFDGSRRYSDKSGINQQSISIQTQKRSWWQSFLFSHMICAMAQILLKFPCLFQTGHRLYVWSIKARLSSGPSKLLTHRGDWDPQDLLIVFTTEDQVWFVIGGV